MFDLVWCLQLLSLSTNTLETKKPPDKKNNRSLSVRFLSIMAFPVTLGIFSRIFRLNWISTSC